MIFIRKWIYFIALKYMLSFGELTLGEVLEMFPIASCVIFPIAEHLVGLLFV